MYLTAVGVTAEPELTSYKLDSFDRILVVASDGVWGVMSSDEAIQIAAKFDDCKEASDAISRESKRRWLKEAPPGQTAYQDDITTVVVNLQQH